MKLIAKLAICMGLSIFLSAFMLSHSFAQETKETSKQTELAKETKEDFLKSLKKYRIAYLSKGDIWIMRGDGSDKKKITQRGDITILFGWSYDDTKLLFGTGKLDLDPAGNYTSGYKLHTIDIEKGEIRRIVKDKEIIYFAEWSPKEDRIAFLDKKENLWITRGDGKEANNLIESLNSQPVWSPMGTHIVCVEISNNGDTGDFFKWAKLKLVDVVALKTEDIAREGFNFNPIWIDNNTIAFEKHFYSAGLNPKVTRSDIWIYDIVNKNLKALAQNNGESYLIGHTEKIKRIIIRKHKDRKNMLSKLNIENIAQEQYPDNFPKGGKISKNGEFIVGIKEGKILSANLMNNQVKEIFQNGKGAKLISFLQKEQFFLFITAKNEMFIADAKNLIIIKVGTNIVDAFWSHKAVAP